MAASAQNVKDLIGDVYDTLGDNDTERDAVITRALTRAQAYVDGYTGNATGDLVDAAVEDAAALQLLQRAIAGSSEMTSIRIGEISIGEKNVNMQITFLKSELQNKLRVLGRKTKAILTSI